MKNIWKILPFIVIIVCNLSFLYGAEMKNENIIILPVPDMQGTVPLETTILKRRSIRKFADKNLTLEQVGQLLWAAGGITDKRGHRSAPSAGAIYPLEIYISKEDGLFHYMPDGHRLKRLSGKDLRSSLQSASLSQSSVGEAAVNIIICADYEKGISRYNKRGMRYIDVEVGHVAQNIHLQAVALGLASVPIGAFNDAAVSEILSLPEKENPLYIIPVGYSN